MTIMENFPQVKSSIAKSKDFRPCFVIPVYNHHLSIQNVVGQLRTHLISCLLIDDGSEPKCSKQLMEIEAREDWITLLKLGTNQGKGVAVCKELKQAFNCDHTHALQVDTDDQHELTGISKFFHTFATIIESH